MMKKVLVIMGNHSPMPSSVANCMQPLIERLCDEGWHVDIVTDRKSMDVAQYEQSNNADIYRIDDSRTMAIILLNQLKKVQLPAFLRAIVKIFANLLKALIYAMYHFKGMEKEFSGWNEKEIVSHCLKLDEIQHYDAILSISLPFKPHLIAEELKKQMQRAIKWFVFEFDPYTFNETTTLSKRRKARLLEQETSVFQNCDHLFLTPELYRFYEKTPLKKYLDKATAIFFANMKENIYPDSVTEKIEFHTSCINALFAGRVYEDIRNPRYTLEVFSRMDDNIRLSLLTNLDNFADLHVQKNIDRYCEKLAIYKFQPRDVTLMALKEADILVNIGNIVVSQVPGKIFEYMATGKPIIHFAKRHDDPAIFYLNHYPMVLIVCEWEEKMERDILEVTQFCMEHSGKKLTYNEVCQHLQPFTSEKIATSFMETFCDVLRK